MARWRTADRRHGEDDGQCDALQDEAKAFAEETELRRRAGATSGGAIDKVAFGTSFKIVMLEGIEVVFIVIAVGAGGLLIVPASIGTGLALVVVAALGLVVHRPLAMWPWCGCVCANFSASDRNDFPIVLPYSYRVSCNPISVRYD